MEFIAQNTTETKSQIAVDSKSSNTSGIVEGGGIVIGGAVLWAVISKLLERFGNTAIDQRQKEIDQKLEEQKQVLLQQRELFEYFKSESSKDSSTLNEALAKATKQVHDITQVFVTKELDTSAQYKDLYYLLLERQKKMEDELIKKNEHIAAIDSTLKDILAFMQMKQRQNG